MVLLSSSTELKMKIVIAYLTDEMNNNNNPDR